MSRIKDISVKIDNLKISIFEEVVILTFNKFVSHL